MNAFIRSQQNTIHRNYKIYPWNSKRYTQIHHNHIARRGNKFNNSIYDKYKLDANLLSFNGVKHLSNFLTNDFWNDGINNKSIHKRYIHITSVIYLESSSKVEESVKTIKTKSEEKKEEQIKEDITQILSPTSAKEKVPAKVAKKPLRTRIWEELVHYYHGFRLLFIDVKVSTKLVGVVLSGKTLTRREKNLLLQTVSDVFRLVPFSVFLVVPFMEFALPIFIKLFPNMLPSTFQTSQDREKKLKQNFAVKYEMAKFLQQTLDHMAIENKKDHHSEEAKEFTAFFRKIKNQNEYVSPDEIIKFSKSFRDEITLDSLSRPQLLALCRILEVPTIGTNNFITFQLRLKMRKLAADDQIISREGVDSLNLSELQNACKSRGMRAYGLSEERLRFQLKDWIQLNLNEKVPSTLLLLSRALMLDETLTTSDQLKESIRTLPDGVLAKTKGSIGELEGKIDNKTKIEIIKEEQKKIKEELEEQQFVEEISAASQIDKIRMQQEQRLEKLAIKAAEERSKITTKDAELLNEALNRLSPNQVLVEKEKIKELKEEIADYKEDLEELKMIPETKGTVKESKAAQILYTKVNSLIGKLENELTTIEKEQCQVPKPSVGMQDLTTEPKVAIKDLMRAVKSSKQVSDATKFRVIESVLSQIDVDKDGRVKVQDILKIVEVIAKDKVNLSEAQISELVEVITKEQVLEAETQIQKALEKSVKNQVKTVSFEAIIDTAPILNDKAKSLDEPINILEDKAKIIEDKLQNPEDRAKLLNEQFKNAKDIAKSLDELMAEPAKQNETQSTSTTTTNLDEELKKESQSADSKVSSQITDITSQMPSIPPQQSVTTPPSNSKDKML